MCRGEVEAVGHVQGEPLEIAPFMGSSRLEEPIGRYPVSCVFHGHAHHGQPEGRTSKNVPVFNVSQSLMREIFPEQPFRLVDIDMKSDPVTAEGSERRTGADRTGAARRC